MQLVYKRAAEALDELCGKRGSLKYIIFSKKKSGSLAFRKRVYAVAIETVKHKAILLPVIESSNLLQLEPQLSRNLALVLLHDFLFRKGIQCGGPLKYCIMRHKDNLRHLFRDTDQKETRPSVHLPKYARINLLKVDVPLVIAAFKEDGYVLSNDGTMDRDNFSIDPILPDVLRFHPLAPLTTHPLYHNSHIILQDKASCLPAYLLAPPPGSNVIDCCAAPGNKTTQLASIMRNKGIITAFDKDHGRFAVLRKRLREAGAICVRPILSDFLQVRPEEYKNTEYILVDPSCSGSGILSRQDYSCEEVSKKRLKKLASFQLRVLHHALTFPAVKRVVYSTCSLYEEENEMVVCKALKKFEGVYELEAVMPEWSCRGFPFFPGGKQCLRSGHENGTNGFFVAVFVRKTVASSLVQQTSKRRKKHRLPVTLK